MLDLNNRPGGPNLIVTAKTAHKVHFLDAETLTLSKTIDMPGSTHELALTADGRTAYGSVYGDGIFIKRVNPDRRIAVIDLPSQSLTRVIDLGETYAPHGVMIDQTGAVWCSGEHGNAVLVIDPATDKVQRIDVGSTAHWIAISHATGKAFVSVKTDEVVVVDVARRAVIDRFKVPQVTEGLATSPDGATLYVCAQTAPEFYAIDARSHAVQQPVAIDKVNQSTRKCGACAYHRTIATSSCRPTRASTLDVCRRRTEADRIVPDQEKPNGLRFRTRRRTRLSVLPR